MEFLSQKIIGERVRIARLNANLTLKELSLKTGIGFTAISKIENGKRKITIDELIKISQYTSKPIPYFIQNGNNAIEYFYPPYYRSE
jgi:transcriptional regulator with XRE-family HTH domain